MIRLLTVAGLAWCAVLLAGCAGPVEIFSGTIAPSALPTAIESVPEMKTPTIPPTPDAAGESLRALAARRGFAIGAAVSAQPLEDEPPYARVLAGEFNLLTVENALKMGPLRPSRDRYDFHEADVIVQFAQEHGMQVRGHTLVWHNQQPDWLTQGQFSRDELLSILKDHIQTVVGRYRGKIAAWDVVNEAIDDHGQMRDTFWLRGIGPDYLDLAFQWAHEADPEARLFYNDYNGEGLGAKSDAIYHLLQGLLARGVPVQGVGLQMHVVRGALPAAQDLAANLHRLAELGLEVHITEMDVRIPGQPTPADLQTQADDYRTVLATCLEEPRCTALVLWGFSDRYSWIPTYFKGYGSALIFDQAYAPKPAYQAIKDELAQP